jgi:hypothetical protein
MELFLLLSIGMSIVAFISITLNQPPPSSAIDQDIEPVFPLESFILATDKMNILKLNNEVVLHGFESNENDDYELISSESSLLQEDKQPSFSEV